MNDYISREAMLNNLTADLEHHSDEGDPRTVLVMQRFIKYVEDFPAADVQPIKRGRWESEHYDELMECYEATCSECGYESTDKYHIADSHRCCENCGARMDQEVENE